MANTWMCIQKPHMGIWNAAAAALCSVGLTWAGCSFSQRAPGAKVIPLRIPLAVVVTPESRNRDLNAQAYIRVFEALGLKARIVLPSKLRSLDSLREKLILAVPLRTASGLSAAQAASLLRLVEKGSTLISEGLTPLSERMGSRPGMPVRVSRTEELPYPEVHVFWEQPAVVVPPQPPEGAMVLTRDVGTGVPLVTLFRHGNGCCLLLAAELDPEKGEGYARFPFLPQALLRAGVGFPFRGERLSALFDYADRVAADPASLAIRWRRAGIKAIHAGAWDFFDPDPVRDGYLKAMIAACHRNGILIFAWLELPHVSRRFWDEHPNWREKTALGADAALDWRSLMNLKDPACFDAIISGLRFLLGRFDWDGVNSAEVYFDSPNGPESPESFTPFNRLVRSEFRAIQGIDPVEFFRRDSPRFWKKDKRHWEVFVDYRVELERLLNERLLAELSRMKNASGEALGLAVTYVDNLYDTKMREAVGADVRGMIPLLERYDFTLIMEDPGTIWHLGPRRYSELAASYGKLTNRNRQLGIDINIVDRFQSSYPTRKQTGTEFCQLFYHAGRSFETVLMYSERTMYDWDLELVAHSLASDASAADSGNEIRVSSRRPVVYRSGVEAADYLVDGKPWPCVQTGDVLLPAGSHRVSAFAFQESPRLPRMVGLNGDLLAAGYDGEKALEFRYRAWPRGLAIFDRVPRSILVDEAALSGSRVEWVLLPRGSHRVRVLF